MGPVLLKKSSSWAPEAVKDAMTAGNPALRDGLRNVFLGLL